MSKTGRERVIELSYAHSCAEYFDWRQEKASETVLALESAIAADLDTLARIREAVPGVCGWVDRGAEELVTVPRAALERLLRAIGGET